MNEQLIGLASETGLFALLFVILFSIQIRESAKREERLLQAKKELAEKYEKREEMMRLESVKREERSNMHHDKTIESLQMITKSVGKIENRLDQGFKEVWARIKSNK